MRGIRKCSLGASCMTVWPWKILNPPRSLLFHRGLVSVIHISNSFLVCKRGQRRKIETTAKWGSAPWVASRMVICFCLQTSVVATTKISVGCVTLRAAVLIRPCDCDCTYKFHMQDTKKMVRIFITLGAMPCQTCFFLPVGNWVTVNPLN